MKDKQDFLGLLAEIDGLEGAEYARLLGDFDFGRYVLRVNRVGSAEDPGDTLFLVRVPQQIAGFPHHLISSPVRRTALEDYLIRAVSSALEQQARFDVDGVARRRISIAVPGQKILPRTALLVTDDQVEARLRIALPLRDGRIHGQTAQDIFLNDLPQLVTAALLYCNLDAASVDEFVNLMEDADQVRQALPTRGLVAFVREGSMLARAADDQPELLHASPLQVSGALRVELDTPNAGAVAGLGIPAGITVVVGDDQSGRIDLMRALAAGIYNHIPGDGREMVITQPDAVYVASEPGRSVQRVDLGAFLSQGEEGGSFRAYTSAAAAAAASQAAGVVEALEVGARALLFDEADSAPGFLSLDQRLMALAGEGSVRTISLARRARQIADELGVSLIIGGGSGMAEFVAEADHVLAVRDFAVTDVTDAARKAVGPRESGPAGEASEVGRLAERARWVVPGSLDPTVGRVDVAVHAPSASALCFGRHTIDLSSLQQLADLHQTATIGLILNYAKVRYMGEGRPLREILDLVDRDLSTEGLECLSRDMRGDLARPRRYEIAAALNRLRSLRIATRTD